LVKRLSPQGKSSPGYDLFNQIPEIGFKMFSLLLTEIQNLAKQIVGVEPKPREEVYKLPKTLGKGILFGRAIGTINNPKVHFPKSDVSHKLIVGAAGSGKTELAKQIVLQTEGVAYLDNADGEAIDDILRALPEERLRKTVVLDHSDPLMPLPISGSEVGSNYYLQDLLMQQWASFFISNFGLEDQYMTLEMLGYACRAVFSVPGTTIMDVIRFIQSPNYRDSILRKIIDKTVKEWWEIFNKQSTGMQSQVVSSFLRRAGIIQQHRILNYTLGSYQVLPYRQWLDEGWTVLIKAPESLGALVCRTIMSLHMLQFWQATLLRDNVEQKKRKTFYIIADEPQTWLSNNADLLDDMFSKARKYGLRLICLFQSLEQVSKESPALMRIMLHNSPDIICFRTHADQGKQLGLTIDTSKMPKWHFAGKVNNEEFLGKGLGKLKPIREDISPIIRTSKQKYNRYWQQLENERVKKWNAGRESLSISQKNLPSESEQDSRKETLKSSNYSTFIE
jgi:hypothetical protein